MAAGGDLVIRRRRVPPQGFLNLGGAIVILALVIPLALHAAQLSPPSIAEFAPQPQHPIAQAPSEQTSTVGRGAGGAAGGAAPSPSPSPPPSLNGALVSRCVGDPPRQIEDPQSPPCVAYWKGNNGGSTWKGVDGNTINIAVPDPAPPPGQPLALTREQKDLQTFFNDRFQFYGRHLVLKPFADAGNHADAPPVQQYHADAATADDQLRAFASLNYPDSGGGEMAYYDDLASRHIISVGDESAAREGEGHVDSHAPYEWRVLPSFDTVENYLGEWVCKQLAGRGATLAGPPFTGMTRKFGILVTTYNDGFTPSAAALQAQLGNCGPQVVGPIYEATGGAQQSGPDSANSMQQLRTAGVTTILCICEAAQLWLWDMPAASKQAYEPEWVVSSFGGGPDWDTNAQAFGSAHDEMQRQLGLSFYNKSVPAAELPYVWAVHAEDSGDVIPDFSAHDQQHHYDGLLLIAAGIQLAGPDLTPANFQRGLFNAAFPDPGAAGPPYYQARVGFGPHHYFFQDAGEIWWSDTDNSTWDNAGAWCWADHGVRYLLGQWPREDAFRWEDKEPCY